MHQQIRRTKYHFWQIFVKYSRTFQLSLPNQKLPRFTRECSEHVTSAWRNENTWWCLATSVTTTRRLNQFLESRFTRQLVLEPLYWCAVTHMYIATPIACHQPTSWWIHCHAGDFLHAMRLCDMLSLTSGVQIPECYHWSVAPRDHLFHAGIIQCCTQRPPMCCLAAFISTHCYYLDFCQAVVTSNKQRVDGWCKEKKWKWSVFRNPVAKWESDRNCLKTNLFFNIPGLQNLQL